MIFILFLAAVGIVWAAGYMAHNWATAHALAVAAMDGGWTIQAEGWASLWRIMAMGFVPGAAISLGLGLVMGGRMAAALLAAREEGANEVREQLAQEREKWEEKITSVRLESNEYAQSINKHVQFSNDKLLQEREKALRAERKSRTIEGRLKGAQQKAERFKKKAQLTTG